MHPAPEMLLGMARQAMAGNQLQLAERYSREALAQAPDSAALLALLGQALHLQQKSAEAEAVFLRLTELNPREPAYWMNVGIARRGRGDVDAALLAFARAAALGAASSDFYYNVALAHIDRQDYESARALLAKAFKLSPQDAEIRFHYAWCCHECMQTEEALAALEDWDGNRGGAWSGEIGHLLMQLGEADRAEPAVRAAADADVHNARAQLTLAQLLERTNRTGESQSIVDRLIADPRAQAELGTDLVLLRAQLAQRAGDNEASISLFREVLAAGAASHQRHFQEFALAKSLDAAGRYDEAFETLTQAHSSQIAYLRRVSPVAVLRGAPALLIADHSSDPADVSQWDESSAPSTQQSPVFIVAFPRSGTTLLELTLDAHPALASMDEQPILQNAIDDILALGIRYPAQLARLSAAQLNEVRDKYWQRVRRKVKLEPGQRLIDKNPLNLLRLPAIRRLFPNAHILLAVRHPCDVIFSCFMQHFRAPDFALLCRDLPTLSGGYRKSFDFWYAQQNILRARAMEVRYETFVDAFADQARDIFEFIEVPWDDVVLQPGKRAMEKRFISTPSYSQVVQPVTTKAVGRWHRYERHFQSSLPILRPYLEKWGYEGSADT